MKILGLDSTGNVCTAAISDNDKLVAEMTVNIGNTHSETLLPLVEQILKLSNTDIDEIELFATSVGPGSFTGVRIGAATVKGLAFGKNLPLCEVSTLEALAENLSAFEGIICPVINARRMQVYNALFSCHNGVITRLCEDRAISVEELDSELAKYDEPIYLSGDGYDICKANFKLAKIMQTPKKLTLANGYSVCLCAEKMHKAGKTVTDRELAPSYLRLSQAERERNEKLNTGVKF